MSSITTSSSPFAAALPALHVFTAYDADGDAIMTDAVTGLPITYGEKRARSHSDSFDSDSTDSRPSKRSRSSDGECDASGRPLSPIKTPRARVGLSVDECPPAPKKGARVPDDDDDHHETALRNLATEMATVVLAGEPRSPPLPPAAAQLPVAELPSPIPPMGDGPAAADEWCLPLNCSDLALRLDMRHPRVLLNFLRFVSTYNELAPEGEDIHLPCMDAETVSMILSHTSIANPAPEFMAEIHELRYLISLYRCACPDCEPDNWSRSDYDSESDHDSE